jgi:hypothetical protein
VEALFVGPSLYHQNKPPEFKVSIGPENRNSYATKEKWITKLLGYDFVVEYKKGQDNIVADALSWRDEDEEQ